MKFIEKNNNKGGGRLQVTGFIPAREGQCMQMHESPGLPSGDSKPFRVDEEQSTGEEVSETRPERKVREQEGTVGGANQKRHHQIHTWGQFSGSPVEGWGRQGHKEQGGRGGLLKPSGRWSHQDWSPGQLTSVHLGQVEPQTGKLRAQTWRSWVWAMESKASGLLLHTIGSGGSYSCKPLLLRHLGPYLLVVDIF